MDGFARMSYSIKIIKGIKRPAEGRWYSMSSVLGLARAPHVRNATIHRIESIYAFMIINILLSLKIYHFVSLYTVLTNCPYLPMKSLSFKETK